MASNLLTDTAFSSMQLGGQASVRRRNHEARGTNSCSLLYLAASPALPPSAMDPRLVRAVGNTDLCMPFKPKTQNPIGRRTVGYA